MGDNGAAESKHQCYLEAYNTSAADSRLSLTDLEVW